MNSVYFTDEDFIKSQTYQNFIKANSGQGILNIRAYAASSAIPISGLNVTISKVIDNLKVIFFEGATDNSGIISQIALPTPVNTLNNMEVPMSQDYLIEASYNDQNILLNVKMYSNIQVLQNINVVPEIRSDGSIYGS